MADDRGDIWSRVYFWYILGPMLMVFLEQSRFSKFDSPCGLFAYTLQMTLKRDL